MIWQDEFDGPDIDRSKWEVLWEESSAGAYGRRDGYWVASFSSVSNGNLVIKTDKYQESWGSGAVRTRSKFEPRYGYIEGRFKMPLNASGQVPTQIAGHWPAFWLFSDTVECDGVTIDNGDMSEDLTYGMGPNGTNLTRAQKCAMARNRIVTEYGLTNLPNANAPEKGLPGAMDGAEVDIFEYWDHNQLSHNIHYDGYGSYHVDTGLYFAKDMPDQGVGDPNNPNKAFFDKLNFSDAQFHTFGLCWTPTEYLFFIDGVLSHKVTANKCPGACASDGSCACADPLDDWYSTYFNRYIDSAARTGHYIKITDEVEAIYGGNSITTIKDLPHFLYVDYVRVYEFQQ